MTTRTETSRDLLVDATWLESRLDDPTVRVVEVDVSPAAHTEGHIPGAVLWDIYADLKDETYRPRPIEAVEDLIRRSGITVDQTVVFYGYAPALGFWLMRHCGHHDVRILDVDRARWQAAGRPWTTDPSTPAASSYPVSTAESRLRADRALVEHRIGDDRAVILDVRSDLEFVGERFWPSGGIPEGGRAGRIPSAVHLPADGLTDDDGAFRGADELAGLLAHDRLVGPDTPIVTYCTVGARAATVWFVLTELLGYRNVRVYDGSWAEWGMDPTTPIVVG